MSNGLWAGIAGFLAGSVGYAAGRARSREGYGQRYYEAHGPGIQEPWRCTFCGATDWKIIRHKGNIAIDPTGTCYAIGEWVEKVCNKCGTNGGTR